MRSVWITSDIGGGDPDDIQSMVHLLQYSDKLDIRGITAGYPNGKLSKLSEVVEAYRIDWHANDKMKENHMVPGNLSIFQGKQNKEDWSMDGSVNALVTESHLHTPEEPLLILSWGACTDVAAALENGLKKKNCFIYFIAGFSSSDWNAIQDKKSFDRCVGANKVRRIFAGSTIRGMYYGWNVEKNRKYVRNRVKPYGRLGKIFWEASSTINTGSYSIKMGDTPSVLWALSSKNLNPEEKSWGGQFVKTGKNMWGVMQGSGIGPYPGARTIKRRRFLRNWRKQIRRIYGD